jgi:hypothetical protein
MKGAWRGVEDLPVNHGLEWEVFVDDRPGRQPSVRGRGGAQSFTPEPTYSRIWERFRHPVRSRDAIKKRKAGHVVAEEDEAAKPSNIARTAKANTWIRPGCAR